MVLLKFSVFCRGVLLHCTGHTLCEAAGRRGPPGAVAAVERRCGSCMRAGGYWCCQ